MRAFRKTCLRPLAALILAAAMALSLAAGSGAVIPWDEMTYVHIDGTDFFADIDALTDAGQAGDSEDVLRLYDSLYDRFALVNTMSSITYIRNSIDVTDPYWADEMVYCDTLNQQMRDALADACHQVMDGPCGDALAQRVGESAARYFREYAPKTERELELAARETELITQYNAKMAALDQVVFPYQDQDWTLERLRAEAQTLDRATYNDIYYGIFDAAARDVGEVFRELVSVRTEMARLRGYEDYNHYAYEELYDRSYTPEQAQVLLDQAQIICREFLGGLAGSPVSSRPVTCLFPLDDQEQMLDVLHRYVGQVDPVFDESWQRLADYGLCDIAAGPSRASGAFTIELPSFGDSAFIYGSRTGSASALETLFHEFGHFTAITLCPDTNLAAGGNCTDLAEIHSTGLELLSMQFYDELYGEDADTARFNTLSSALSIVTGQSFYAQFEAAVYAQPDMTLEQIGLTYDQLLEDYGYGAAGRPNQTWIQVPHFFSSPDYIVSYVAAAMASLQIWAAAEDDWRAGADIYMGILRAGFYDADYFQVLDSVGLASFAQSGTVETVCRRALVALADLEADILGEAANAA